MEAQQSRACCIVSLEIVPFFVFFFIIICVTNVRHAHNYSRVALTDLIENFHHVLAPCLFALGIIKTRQKLGSQSKKGTVTVFPSHI